MLVGSSQGLVQEFLEILGVLGVCLSRLWDDVDWIGIYAANRSLALVECTPGKMFMTAQLLETWPLSCFLVIRSRVK